jgi:hypothetical protein
LDEKILRLTTQKDKSPSDQPVAEKTTEQEEQKRKFQIGPPLVFWDMPNTIHGIDRSLILDGVNNISQYSRDEDNPNAYIMRRDSKRSLELTIKSIINLLLKVGNLNRHPQYRNWIIRNNPHIKTLPNKEIQALKIQDMVPVHYFFFQDPQFIRSEILVKEFQERRPLRESFPLYVTPNIDQILREYPDYNASNCFPINIKNVVDSYLKTRVTTKSADEPVVSADSTAFIEEKYKFDHGKGSPMDVDNAVISMVWKTIAAGLKKDRPVIPACIVLGLSDSDYINLIQDLTDFGLPVFVILHYPNVGRQIGTLKHWKLEKLAITFGEARIDTDYIIKANCSDYYWIKSDDNDIVAKKALMLVRYVYKND